MWPARHYASEEQSADYPPMGQRFRLRADFDITGFSPDVQVILRALQTYGAVVGDTSGGPVELKVENLFAEHSPDRWAHIKIGADSLAKLPLSDYEVVKLGYGSPAPNEFPCGSVAG